MLPGLQVAIQFDPVFCLPTDDDIYTQENNMCSSTACTDFDADSVNFLRKCCPPSAAANYSCAEILVLYLILQGMCLIKT